MHFNNLLWSGIGVAAIAVLSSCGGGAGGAIDPIATQRLIGGSPPAETGRAQAAREADILSRSDSLILTAFAFESEDGENRFVVVPNCSGATCTFGSAGNEITLNLSDFAASTGTAILSRSGLTVLHTYNPQRDLSYLGSALNHSSFGAIRYVEEIGEESYFVRHGTSIGDLAGSRPTASGSWTGLMTGLHWRSDDLLLGDANISYVVSGTGGSLGAEFSNIQNVTRNRAHDTAMVRFSGIAVAADGTFRSGGTASRGNWIEGGFYGSGTVEAAGIFERSGILGAFGAYRRD